MNFVFEKKLLGIGVRVSCDEPSLVERLAFDFDGFPQQPVDPASTPEVEFQVHLEPYHPPADLRESFRGPTGVCFDQKEIRHILYPGPVWIRFSHLQQRGTVYGEDLEAVYERLYLSLLSRLGERLETAGLHRLHGLALDSPWGTCLFLMRAGVGKSNLAYSLLQRPGWRLISEDTPLLDAGGRLHPFPFRLGLRRQGLNGAKNLVRASSFARVQSSLKCDYLFAGAWITGDHPQVGELGTSRALALLFRDGVIGLGVPQVAELFVRPGARDRLQKLTLALRRLRAVLPLLKARKNTIFLTPDGERNSDFLEQLLEGDHRCSGRIP